MAQFKVLPSTYILSPLTCFSKKRLFEEISNFAAGITGIDERTILHSLNQRESFGATVCAKGVGMPHAVLKDLDHSVAILAILSNEVPYHTVDSERMGVDVAFACFFSPKDKHAKAEEMLSFLSYELSNVDLVNSLRRSWQDNNKILQVLLKLDGILSEQLKVDEGKDSESGEGVVSTIRNFISEAIQDKE